MVSFNVKSLHTSIPNAGGIKTVKVSFDKHTSKNVVTKVIKTFWLFLQIKGCVMGTICEPFHTSIFMDHFEKKYIHPLPQGLSFIYLWFIDDIIFIWSATKEKLTNCLMMIIGNNTPHHHLRRPVLALKVITSFHQRPIKQALHHTNIWLVNCYYKYVISNTSFVVRPQSSLRV